MATVVLQTVGTAIGGAIGGPVGAMLGRAAGAAAGYALDQKLFTKDQVIEGPRLDGTRVLSSAEGAPVPKVYGRTKISGQVIWATRFEEVSRKTSSGGKGGSGQSATTNTFAYYANFAVGICDGPVSGLRRIWADGEELDLTRTEFRFYQGSDDQLPDPLIEAKQGLGNAPAYRGTAYVVFEGLALEKYGNRIPQLSFEVVRGVGRLEKEIKAITVIPGSTEYGYGTNLISTGGQGEAYNAHNRHMSIALTDWEASMDELQMVCSNLEAVSLVVSWFGTDLRAGECDIQPGVTTHIGGNWQVGALKRHEAHLVSTVNGRPAYGGTPSDASILEAIADLKHRGLKVTLYPFLLMDIANDNVLPALSDEGFQPAYPWRGEISCFPASASAETVDKTAEARAQLTGFAARYRALVLHYANLCASIGGVSGFVIGSEMRGLTKVRDGDGAFPFVETLIALAYDVKQILGDQCLVTYAADWSEYFGYQPQDGSGDVLFNLDPLWASPAIGAIGIDNYMPLSDWRDEGDPGSPLVKSPTDIEYLKANIAANEGYDWYYESSQNRSAGIRSAITDGLNEPWIYRYKDLVSWWSNPHHNRLGGVRQTEATEWVPQSKPIHFTELGCPAVDKGANQPNVFHDPKSAQSALPYFSSGGRDDLIQRRFLEAHFEHWSNPASNPVSAIYGKPMVDVNQITPWAWDARPFPWFPLETNIWSDGPNWQVGHWLTGRLGGCSLSDLVEQILMDFDYSDAVLALDGIVDGYVIPANSSPRAALEPLLSLHNVDVLEEDGKIVFQQQSYARRTEIDQGDLVQERDSIEKYARRMTDLELPAEAVVSYASIFGDYEEAATKTRRLEGDNRRQISMRLPAVMPETTAARLAEARLRYDWFGRDECRISLSSKHLDISCGDIVSLSDQPEKQWLVEGVDIEAKQDLSLRSIQDHQTLAGGKAVVRSNSSPAAFYGAPQAILMDLPLLRSSDAGKTFSHLAVSAMPWARDYSVFSSPSQDGFQFRTSLQLPATTGTLLSPLPAGPLGRWDRANEIQLSLTAGQFESIDNLGVLNGRNALAVESLDGGYEIIQFADAELQEDGSWSLRNLLRGQAGTEPEMNTPVHPGAQVVLLDEAVIPIDLESNEVGLVQNWRIGPSVDEVSADTYVSLTHTNDNRSRRMIRPVHLRAYSDADDTLKFTWIRQSRIDGDSWEGAEIPLDASVERYLVRIYGDDDVLRREMTVETPGFAYSLADRIADLGEANAPMKISVAQIGDNGMAGHAVTLEIPQP